jgi:hypothetical protein
MLRAQGVLPSLTTATGTDRFRQETAPVPQYIRAVGAPLPRASGTGVHAAVQREIETLLAGEWSAARTGPGLMLLQCFERLCCCTYCTLPCRVSLTGWDNNVTASGQ